MNRKQPIHMVDFDYHRNGISGAPFHAVLFDDIGDENTRKLAIVFEAPHHCAVLDVAKLAQGIIAFGQNSYRGDVFEDSLRQALRIPEGGPPMNTHRNTIIRGDCLDILPQFAARSVDFVLTDPPYITRYKSRDGRTVPNDDNDAWLKPAFAEMYRVLANHSFCVSFYGWSKVDRFMQAYRAAGFRVVGHLMFPKRYASSTRFLRYSHESAHLLAKGNPRPPERPIADVIEWQYTGNKLHPTQKPLSVLLPLVETFSAPSGLVLDPFSGSGSTLLAAKRLGRSYLGIELDADYHAIASKRLEREQGDARPPAYGRDGKPEPQ